MAALNLLNAYGSDSEDDSDNSESLRRNEECHGTLENNEGNFFEADDASSSGEDSDAELVEGSSGTGSEGLQNPFRSLNKQGLTQGTKCLSVFANPFKDAEEAEKSTLEKHVKLAPKLEDVKEINGRKICWNFRKGRCRFGSNCVFAHDSELVFQEEKKVEPSANSQIISRNFPKAKVDTSSSSDTSGASGRKGSKRPGLSQGIVPGKKVLKMFRKQQAAEEPWTVTK